MELNIERAEYLLAVAKANHDLKIPADRISTSCAECGECIEEMGPQLEVCHVLARFGDAPDGGMFMVMGCEGYWYVDPSLVGIERSGWQDWQDED